MFRRSYQRGMLTVFYSCGSKPFALWDTFIKDGFISRFMDQDLKSMVCEISGTNVSTTYMICPKGKMELGITMPFLVMIVKNLKKYFSFEVTALDESNTRRRFRISNFQSTTQVTPMCTVMPIGLSEGWNQIQFNIAEFMRRAYKKQFIEVLKLKINANIRLRRIYFAERLLPENELPAEYRLYFPLASKAKDKKKDVLQVSAEPFVEGKRTSKEDLVEIRSKTEIKSASIHGLISDGVVETAVSAVKSTVQQAQDIEVAAGGVPSAMLEEKKSVIEADAAKSEAAMAKSAIEISAETEDTEQVTGENLNENVAEHPAETDTERQLETIEEVPTEEPGEPPSEVHAEIQEEPLVESREEPAAEVQEVHVAENHEEPQTAE